VNREAGQVPQAFEGLIVKAEKVDSAWVTIPDDVVAAFSGVRPPVPVQASFDGEPFEGWLLKGEDGAFIIVINKSIRKKIGKQAGDKVRVTLAPRDRPSEGTVESYFSQFSPAQNARMRELRALLLKLMPGVTEKLAWAVPNYLYGDDFVVSLVASKGHLGLYPGKEAITALKDKLAGYALIKNGIHLPWDQPIPEALVKSIIDHQLAIIGKP
jgi:uncharacterized protein YdhG (YjbR/CyaY superfamily)